MVTEFGSKEEGFHGPGERPVRCSLSPRSADPTDAVAADPGSRRCAPVALGLVHCPRLALLVAQGGTRTAIGAVRTALTQASTKAWAVAC